MRPLPQELIRRKRDGGRLEDAELRFIAGAIADGTLADAQIAAFAMAVLWRGLDPAETASLTLGMRDSGRVLTWADLPGPVLDKHSTGGVGDKVSLVLAPIIAACGGFVPMLSGRGLGHTGGTLDKLESIPGYLTAPDLDLFQRVVREAGCAIIGQTDELAPADRRFYAIRDVTATVESVPLITASILSKKLAAGLQGLVMDVKVGSGAFLPAFEQARELARSIVSTAHEAGLGCSALLTGMDQCLGATAGNALEVHEALAMLRGETVDPRLEEVVTTLAAEILVAGGLARDGEEARQHVAVVLGSGAAAERFERMVSALGGPRDLLSKASAHLPTAPVQLAVQPDRPGHVRRIDVRALGLAIVRLGGGRTHPAAGVDHAVGLSDVAALGEEVGERPLAVVHARDEAAAMAASNALLAAYEIGDRLSHGPRSLVVERVGQLPPLGSD